jgi:hypothetical protein
MKNTLIVVLVFVAIMLMSIIFAFLPRHGTVVYNCSIVEISPDIPVAVKQECRKKRMENI